MTLNDTNVFMGAVLSFKFSGFRFDTDVSGLSGVTIDSAIITWRARATDVGSFISTMYAEDSGAAPGTFTTTSNDITDRTRTTASVAAGGAELGEWTSGQDYTLTVTSLIQELADSYDPSVIVLLSIWISGTGERVATAFDSDQALAAKLVIDFTAAGGVTVTPTAHNFAWAIPTPSLTYTPATLAYGWAIPTPVVVAGVLVSPSALAYGWSIPTPTWSGITTYTPSAVAYGWEHPEPSVVIGVQITPTVLAYGWAIPTPTFSPQVATFTPSAHNYAWVIPTPTVSNTAVVFGDWGEITRVIDVADYPDGALYYLEVILQTSNVAVPAFARIYSVTVGNEVDGSEISTTGTTPTRVRSAAITLTDSQTYKVQFGGQSGSQITMHGAVVVVETN